MPRADGTAEGRGHHAPRIASRLVRSPARTVKNAENVGEDLGRSVPKRLWLPALVGPLVRYAARGFCGCRGQAGPRTRATARLLYTRRINRVASQEESGMKLAIVVATGLVLCGTADPRPGRTGADPGHTAGGAGGRAPGGAGRTAGRTHPHLFRRQRGPRERRAGEDRRVDRRLGARSAAARGERSGPESGVGSRELQPAAHESRRQRALRRGRHAGAWHRVQLALRGGRPAVRRRTGRGL